MTKVFSKKHLVFAIFACCPVVYAAGMEHALFVLLNLVWAAPMLRLACNVSFAHKIDKFLGLMKCCTIDFVDVSGSKN